MPASESGTSLLLKSATPDLYRRNAFRVTGLPVTASVREVAKQADKLKMLAELGGQAAQHLAVVPGMEPPTPDEIREAAQRLKDVEARALDEFFWFWPENWENADTDEAFVALKRNDLSAAFQIWQERETEHESFVASHNVALVFHMRALEWAHLDFVQPLPSDRVTKVASYWKHAFDRWEWLADDDRLWDAFKSRIRQVNDPALSTGFARRLRAELPQAFDKINAELALTYAELGRKEEAEWHVMFLKSTHEGSDNVTATIDVALAPTRARLERSIETAWQATRADKRTGMTNASKLMDSAEPLLSVFDMFHETGSAERCRLIDEVAQAALGCAIDGYNSAINLPGKARQSAQSPDPKKTATAMFVRVLSRAKALATDLDLRQRLESNIATATGNLQFDVHIKPLLDALAAIQKLQSVAPAERLRRLQSEIIPSAEVLLKPGALEEEAQAMLANSIAIVLRGIAISANNDFQQPAASMRALTIAVKFARDPQIRDQIKRDAETLGRNMGQAPSPKNNGCALLLVGGIVVIILINIFSDSTKSSSTYSNQYKPSPTTKQTTKPRPTTQSSPSIPPPLYEPRKLPSIPEAPAPLSAPEAAPQPLDRNGWHVWKNSSLQEITAKMISFDGSNVIIQKADGTTYTYPLNKLSGESQTLVWKLDAIPVAEPMPPTGVFRGPRVADSNTGPLSIRTQYGSGNYYVKLVSIATGLPRMVIFIRDGATATDISVPSGTYEIRYASGETWYGEKNLFGAQTSYNKADETFTFGGGSGYTIELYKQLNGNLSTSSINKDNF